LETKIRVRNKKENYDTIIILPDSKITTKAVKVIEDWFNDLMGDNIKMTIVK
jgi:hypothetical protein